MKSIKFDGNDVYPSKIICIGRNYVEHIHELGNEVPDEPVIFIKPNSAIANKIYVKQKGEIHYEGEITFLVKQGEIVGVGFGLDLTKRDLQSALKAKGLPWERSKAFDNAAVLSDFVSLNDDLNTLKMELRINGKLVQQGGYALMLHKPNDILREVSSFLTVEDGDLLMTGTPAGVGVVKAGDMFNGKIYSNDVLLVEATWEVEAS